MMLRLIVSILLLAHTISVFAITFDAPSPPKSKPIIKNEEPSKRIKIEPSKRIKTESPAKQLNMPASISTPSADMINTESENPIEIKSQAQEEKLLLSLSAAERKTKENVEELRQIKNFLDTLAVQMDVEVKQITDADSIDKISALDSRFQENINIADDKAKVASSLLSFIRQTQDSIATIKTGEKGKVYINSIENQILDANNMNQQIENLLLNIRKNRQQINDTKIVYNKKQQEMLELQRKKESMDIFRKQKMDYIQTINQQNSSLIGKIFKDCEKCPEMVVIPAGRFFMGSKEGDGRSDEQPQHEVFISKPFAISKFEITFAEWDFCVTDGGCFDNKTNDGGWGRDKRPVIFISWNDAKNYVKWLSRKTGKNYRLLTEAEWEYVARASTNTKYWWGDQIIPNVANCDGCGSVYDNKKTAPVGTFVPNKFGIVDTLGNVYEWVEDCYSNSYNEASVDGLAFVGQCDESRVLRGGSWSTSYERLRSATRKKASPITQMDDYGMRIAKDL